MGRDAFVAEVEKEYGAKLRRAAGAQVTPRMLADKHGHIGVHAQKQAGLNYLGLVLPVGRVTVEQMRGIAEIAQRFGSGTIRFTVWQNLLISDVADRDVGVCIAAIAALGLGVEASAIRRGLRRLHRQCRLQVRGLEHQGPCAEARRLSRDAARRSTRRSTST